MVIIYYIGRCNFLLHYFYRINLFRFLLYLNKPIISILYLTYDYINLTAFRYIG